MKQINTEIGSIYVLDKPYWAGEHTFHHCSNMADNVRGLGMDLWSVDIYTRSGIDPIKHSKRTYIWATDEKAAAREAMRYANEGITVLLTHMLPLEDKLREPAIR